MKANFEGTFSLSNFSPFYQTLETDHGEFPQII